MSEEVDETFYQRADAHIRLSNDQLNGVSSGKVSASMMYSLARFNAWLSARGVQNPEQMREARDGMIEYFVGQYKQMLEHNLDDYIENFDRYVSRDESETGAED